MTISQIKNKKKKKPTNWNEYLYFPLVVYTHARSRYCRPLGYRHFKAHNNIRMSLTIHVWSVFSSFSNFSTPQKYGLQAQKPMPSSENPCLHDALYTRTEILDIANGFVHRVKNVVLFIGEDGYIASTILWANMGTVQLRWLIWFCNKSISTHLYPWW